MNIYTAAILLVNAIALLLLPLRWAPIPLLMGALYVIEDARIFIGSLNFNVIRILIATGLVRVIIRGERLEGRMNSLDKLMAIWALWMLVSSFFHKDLSASIINRLGLIFDAGGIYFLLRIFIRSLDEIIDICRITAILLLPVAIEMLYESQTGHNLFFALGGSIDLLEIREGHFRAKGPFAHPVLAGTVGAVCLQLIIYLWKQHRKTAIVGILACVTMIYTCASSGPILTVLAGIVALSMWRYRQHIRIIQWMAVFSYIGLELVMRAPSYYIISRIGDISGGTGWHRAYLIETSIAHIHEWWLVGTDYTRHWMPTGVPWSEDHTDITNYYIKMGVIGGIPLMLLFIAILYKGFSFVGQMQRQTSEFPQETRIFTWVLGASLFAITVSFISVTYFDQSIVFLYLTLSAISTLRDQYIT